MSLPPFAKHAQKRLVSVPPTRVTEGTPVKLSAPGAVAKRTLYAAFYRVSGHLRARLT